MEVLLRFLYGTTAVMAVPRRSWRCRCDPTADWPNPRWNCGSFEHVQSFRRAPAMICSFEFSAVLQRSMAEARRSWLSHCGLCRTSTAVAPRLRCDGTSTAETQRNMFKVAAVPPRRSAVYCGDTAEHVQSCRRATAKVRAFDSFPRYYDDQWRNHCGTTAIMAVSLRFISYKHRSGTAPLVWRGYEALLQWEEMEFLTKTVGLKYVWATLPIKA